MHRPDIPRGPIPLLLVVLLLPGLALAQEPGSLQLSAQITPRYLGNGRQDVFAVLELRAQAFPPGERPPASVALVIDRSASTAGRRLLIARKAALSVIDGLQEQDHLTVISVSDRPQVHPLVPMTPENREKLKAHVAKLTAEGRSDLSAGMDAAIEELSAPSESDFYRQVIVFSDGRPTDGMVDQDGLAEIAREAREEHNIRMNTVAIGDDADFELMAGLAKKGWGFAATLNDSAAAPRVAKRQQLDLVQRAANAVELRVKAAPTVTLLGVMGLDGTIQGNLARIPVGEIGPGETVQLVLHLSTDNVGKQVRPIELIQLELEYEDGPTERRQKQSLTLQAELNLAKAKGRGALNLEALGPAALAYVEKHTARADEAAEEGNLAGAREILQETREKLKQLGAVARLALTPAMALLTERGAQILEQQRLQPKPAPQPGKKKKR